MYRLDKWDPVGLLVSFREVYFIFFSLWTEPGHLLAVLIAQKSDFRVNLLSVWERNKKSYLPKCWQLLKIHYFYIIVVVVVVLVIFEATVFSTERCYWITLLRPEWDILVFSARPPGDLCLCVVLIFTVGEIETQTDVGRRQEAGLSSLTHFFSN